MSLALFLNQIDVSPTAQSLLDKKCVGFRLFTDEVNTDPVFIGDSSSQPIAIPPSGAIQFVGYADLSEIYFRGDGETDVLFVAVEDSTPVP